MSQVNASHDVYMSKPNPLVRGVVSVVEIRGGGILGSSFAGYVPLAPQNPHTIIVYSVANYRHHRHFWANIIVNSRTEFKY